MHEVRLLRRDTVAEGKTTIYVSRPAGIEFGAGRIDITPFCSTALDAAHARLPRRIVLLYGNCRREEAAFRDELQEIEKRNSDFCLVALIFEPQKWAQPRSGETGFIRRDLIERHVADPKSAFRYFAASPAMTAAIHAQLCNPGIVETAMRCGEFRGYRGKPLT